jgi:hypothetical protein
VIADLTYEVSVASCAKAELRKFSESSDIRLAKSLSRGLETS